MHLYTVATANRGYLDALCLSAKRSDMSVHVLGCKSSWGGFMWRYELLLQAIEQPMEQPMEQRASYIDDYVMIVDGYDTIVCKKAEEFETHFLEECKKHELDADTTIFMAPEHHKEWCSWLFDRVLHNASKLMFNVPLDKPYVINAGVLMGKRTSVVRYIRRIQQFAAEHSLCDDQKVVNSLYYKQLFQPSVDGFALHVDLTGGMAYCHANRHFGRCILSACIDHNRHTIDHEKDLDLSSSGSIVLRRGSQKVGVLHAIANADIDQLCEHLDLPVPLKRKTISQPSLRAGMIAIKSLLVGIVFAVLFLPQALRSDCLARFLEK